MPVSIVVGGQFGSEGKGKVALEIVRRTRGPVTVVRVGGPNSGHTAYDRNGKKWALRQMPAACIDRNVDVVFPAGSYLDVEILLREIADLAYPAERIFISHFANVITEQHKAWETNAGLISTIGSTGSGVGTAVMASVAREAGNFPVKALHARDHGLLQPFLRDTTTVLHNGLQLDRRIVVEGSQGFGLSLLDGGYWPKATARSTTAAAALAEAGVSPRHVDDITLVIRSFPIRVAGDSGPLPGETTWEKIRERSLRMDDLKEYTTVTRKLRRVGEFDGELVRRAIRANAPHRIVLNHMDYVGPVQDLDQPTSRVRSFVSEVETAINQKIDWFGFDPLSIVERPQVAFSR
ncbi:adenylosuccinate synthetase [Mesorhizobium sp. dw_380]|uniref:adenylosuccinate synthetase n=1 Tax=Mesorhizobium sp. dw_380 TaxID=2812001 RepID=UPI001BDE01C1|nr:adenylosuccinate synthetase [Mesorhizobium sp. dw_380]